LDTVANFADYCQCQLTISCCSPVSLSLEWYTGWS